MPLFISSPKKRAICAAKFHTSESEQKCQNIPQNRKRKKEERNPFHIRTFFTNGGSQLAHPVILRYFLVLRHAASVLPSDKGHQHVPRGVLACLPLRYVTLTPFVQRLLLTSSLTRSLHRVKSAVATLLKLVPQRSFFE